MGGCSSMGNSVIWLLLLGLAIHALVPAMADRSNARVSLRIEGEFSTIFEGATVTRGHNVTTASGGTHHCDGTNNGQNLTPGPTPTTALDDAARMKNFTYDGTYAPEFDDFFITRIGASAQTPIQFWGLLVNYQFTSGGGCTTQVRSGDEVLWAFDAFNKAHFLKLSGPQVKVKKNKPFQLTVIDGTTGVPVSGAVVGGNSSDAAGIVTLTLHKCGRYKFKAEGPNSIRSNSVTVNVS